MKLVKLITTTTSNYPFDWSRNTKEQLLSLSLDDLGGSSLVANFYEDRGGFMVQVFIETKQTTLVNIDNIFRFTPLYKPTISGKSGGTTLELDKEVFETNFWGPVRCIQAALPTMRAQRSGHIVQVSSIAGRIGLPAQPIYSASKWALEGLSENLAHDLSSFGVRVSIIEPGVTRTAILGKNNTVPDNDDFKEVYARMLDMYMEGIEANVKPEEVSETILSCLETPNGQLRWPVAWGAETMVNARHDGSVSDTEWTEIGSLVNDREKWVSSFKQALNL